MRKLLCFIALMCIPFISYAGSVSIFKTYATNDQVTATNLNGNINSIVNVINGGLDNTNANTTSGYRFMEVLGSLPSAGTQGRTVFLTTQNTLNFDTGSVWNSVISITSPTQGDILYYNGTAWTKLGAGTANYALVTNGAGANPAFETELGWTKTLRVSYAGATGNVAACYPAGVTVTNTGQGNETVNFGFNFTGTTYQVVIGVGNSGQVVGYDTKAIGTVRIATENTAGGAVDCAEATIVIFEN